MEKCVVLIGDFFTGIQTIHGPFEDSEHAQQWACLNAGIQLWTIIKLTPLS